MSQDKIIEILRTIKYPGFSRDIISFGMVRDIGVQDGAAVITLVFQTDKPELKSQLAEQIKAAVQSLEGISKVQVIFEETTAAPKAKTEVVSEQKRIPGVKNIIAIASGKGGVGKSTVAVNLATTLSKDYKVGILDLDIYGPSLPLIVGQTETPQLTAEQKIIPVKKYGMELMSFGFISGNQSPTIWRGPLVARMTQQFFDDVIWGDLDFLILDLPPGTGDVQLTLCQKFKITGAVIVTTPQELALLDVRKGADMFRKVNTPVLGIVENMTHFLCPHCGKTTKIFSGQGGEAESLRLQVPLLGQIYMTPEIAAASDSGKPYVLQYPESPITAIYRSIADKLIHLVA